jgi:hypothetical protein
MRNTCFLRCFQAPSNITKYDGKINPSVWLEDYRLACIAGGANDDLFIIQFLPIYLAESTRAWLDHLPRNAINRWDDLWEVFTGNFQNTYVCPSNPWDLRGCRQKQGEPLRDYIRRFSQKCHTLPSVTGADLVLAFWDGTTCRTLVHKFGRKQPETIKELIEIAT